MKIYGEEHAAISACYNNICDIYRAKGQFDKALEYCSFLINKFAIKNNAKSLIEIFKKLLNQSKDTSG